MNKNPKEVLIVIGPTGSGKTSLASYAAKKLGWHHIEEDDYWMKNGWRNQRRTVEHELIVQQQVSELLQKRHEAGEGVVLEFILYKHPPNPLTAYTEFLDKHSISYRVIALRPRFEEIIKRIEHRGRKADLDDLEDCRQDVKNQIQCLEANNIKPTQIIDSTSMTVSEIFQRHILRPTHEDRYRALS